MANVENDTCSLEFFAHIDDLLDFSEAEIANPASDICKNEFLVGGPAKICSEFSGSGGEGQDSGDLYVPCDDMAELEWLSTFYEEYLPLQPSPLPGFDGIPPKQIKPEELPSEKPLTQKIPEEFCTSSPTSVLETAFPSQETAILRPETSFTKSETAIPGRRRTKRPRPALPKICWSRSLIISPTCSMLENHSEDSGGHSGESRTPEKKNSGKRKLENWPEISRKCLHCSIQKTPQWRTGPMGPKTLCNACGVRYKSGRLLPEYRPAASPTFVPSKHSNSHRKVMEMRTKKWNREEQEYKEQRFMTIN